MTLRTPRRRISPRTRLRYRAIREFFRRALGSNSQQSIQINSTIAVNVTDLKRKIVGLEQQLDEVSKHCRDIVSLDQSRRESETSSQFDLKQHIAKLNSSFSERKSNDTDTELVFKADRCLNSSENSDYGKPSGKAKNVSYIKQTEPNMATIEGHISKHKLQKISHTENKLHKYKTGSDHDDSLIYSTSSFHSLTNTKIVNSPYRHSNDTKKQYKEESTNDIVPSSHKSHKHSGHSKYYTGDHLKPYYEDKPREKMRKPKRVTREIDSEFIADIIRRQYKPVKLFNRKEADLSQFSAPICRDQDYPTAESPKYDGELCSYLHGDAYPCKHVKAKRYDLNVMQSVCDTRLYSSKKHARAKNRKMIYDANSNSDMYDLVPVKERSSPKSRKKIVEECSEPYECYKEVPPSPRTHRPRLNLKAQYYTETEDFMAHHNQPVAKDSPKPEQQETDDNIDLIDPIVVKPDKKTIQSKHLKNTLLPIEEKTAQQDRNVQDVTIQDIPDDDFTEYGNEQTSIAIDTLLSKSEGTEISVDKTDKALTEIKDILQSFLHEIKKETVTLQSDKSDTTFKTPDENNVVQDRVQDSNQNLPPSVLPNSQSNSQSAGQCAIPPLIAPFTNPCCYQVLPMCPVNCPLPVPNGYVMPSQSFTCTNCVKPPNESNSNHCCNNPPDTNPQIPCPTETDELIKEIYKFVAQGPIRNHEDGVNEQPPEPKKDTTKPLTTRSVGGSNKFCKQDANVGTQSLKCYSKSCEAVWSKVLSDAYVTDINESYSDSLLEKLSVEIAPQSASETEIDSTPTDVEKNKGFGGFAKVLRSFGIFKKKKKEIIEETSESESVTNNIDFLPSQSVYKQNITNYMMYGQEYFPPPNEPLYPRPHDYSRPHEYQRFPPEYNPGWHDYPRGRHEYPPDYGLHRVPSTELFDPYAQRYHPQIPEHRPDYARNSKRRPLPATVPQFSSFDASYNQVQPDVCLKEIEVKSTGTQSERKISIFKKMKKKMKQPANNGERPHQRVAFSYPCYQPMMQAPNQPMMQAPHQPFMHAPNQPLMQAPNQPLMQAPNQPLMRAPNQPLMRAPNQPIMQPPHQPTMQVPNQPTTQASNQPTSIIKQPSKFSKPSFWKGFQVSRAVESFQQDFNYSLKTREELLAGDQNIRKALLKKMFNKRNPFSPRNALVKTLLGKDKSAMEELARKSLARPKMFM